MKRFSCAVIILLLFTISGFSRPPIEGRWRMYHPATGKKFGIIKIFKHFGKFHGRIVWLLNKKTTDWRRDKKPLLGKLIMFGFTYNPSNQEFSGGRIYNPDNGSTYKCYLKIVKKGRLKVRGYVLIPLFGKTIYLFRES